MLSRASRIYLATAKEFFSCVGMRWIGRHIPRSDAPDQIPDAFRAAGGAPDQSTPTSPSSRNELPSSSSYNHFATPR